jgi:wyosine [tRNA(Phe)-imidazoG37] synthetase (radical SAM superfamily)
LAAEAIRTRSSYSTCRTASLDPVWCLWLRPGQDYWERFRECLSLLKHRRQRTVYRLTLVKGWNMSEAGGYADLVALGAPDFIEIKGVTYCGSSGASA